MATYTNEELEEYFLENNLYTTEEIEETDISLLAQYNGFSWDSDINKWIPL
jgi:hypothetical protein